ncbi:MAG: hypothetical protein SFV24_19305 [Gemmatimonadales bacterium]|nr:hypothetical protein [Gemmatimonadales bacterium]
MCPDCEKYHAALRAILDTDDDMGIYPAAVIGAGAELDYKQRDGFKNGWNAAVMEYGRTITKYAYEAGVISTTDAREYADSATEGL